VRSCHIEIHSNRTTNVGNANRNSVKPLTYGFLCTDFHENCPYATAVCKDFYITNFMKMRKTTLAVDVMWHGQLDGEELPCYLSTVLNTATDSSLDFSVRTFLQSCWWRIKSSGMGLCRLAISYIRFGGDFCFHLQYNLAMDNFDGGGNKVLQNVEAWQPILWHIIPEYCSLLEICFHTIFKNIFNTYYLTKRSVILFNP